MVQLARIDTVDVLNAIKSQLVTAGVFQGHQIFISAQREPASWPPSAQFCVVKPGRQPPHPGAIAGSGNDFALTIGTFETIVYSKLLTDSRPRDDHFLTDASLGLYQKVRQVKTALQMHFPTINFPSSQPQGAIMFAEPMRWLDQDGPEGEDRWDGRGRVNIHWEVQYSQIMT